MMVTLHLGVITVISMHTVCTTTVATSIRDATVINSAQCVHIRVWLLGAPLNLECLIFDVHLVDNYSRVCVCVCVHLHWPKVRPVNENKIIVDSGNRYDAIKDGG